MNRVIKCRAWDTLAQQWLQITGFETAETCESKGYTLEGVFHNGDFVGNDDIVIVQFTGLLDKNGVEIYEGDIIELHQFLFDGFGEVEKELRGVVVYQPGTCSFALDRVDNKNIKEYMGYEEDEEVGPLPIFLFYGLHEESFTVIGNRFEHPHLLEGM